MTIASADMDRHAIAGAKLAMTEFGRLILESTFAHNSANKQKSQSKQRAVSLEKWILVCFPRARSLEC